MQPEKTWNENSWLQVVIVTQHVFQLGSFAGSKRSKKVSVRAAMKRFDTKKQLKQMLQHLSSQQTLCVQTTGNKVTGYKSFSMEAGIMKLQTDAQH